MKTYNYSDICGTLGEKKALFVVEYVKDSNPRRAARIAGFHPDKGHKLLEEPEVLENIIRIRQRLMDYNKIDSDTIIAEAWDNHHIARQEGNINASNTALGLIAKTAKVDAFAAEKLVLASSQELSAQLMRARKRRQQEVTGDSEDSDILESGTDEVSFL